MPFGFSFGGNKSNTNGSFNQNGTQDQTIHQTTTPTNPTWVDRGAQDIYGGTANLGGANPQNYVAGPNSLLTTAGANAQNLSGTPWAYDAASDVTRGVANAAPVSISANISKFMNPYLSSVVDATGADLDHNAALTRSQQSLDLARSGAFGGSGAALDQSMTEGELARARATTLGGLRSAGYNTALGAATNQAQLQQQQEQQRLQAGGQLASIANDYGATARANVASQDSAGAPLQAIDQAKATAPLDLQSWLTKNYSNLPLSLFHGQTDDGIDNTVSTSSGTSKGNTSGFNFGFTAGGK